jgi:catechol 2,3-dioxygenase-like lactoylglutathione lyase family enzyme
MRLTLSPTLMALALAGAARAEPAPPAPALELGAVTILVRDEDEAAAWYGRNLGWEVAMNVRGADGERFVAMRAPGGAQIVLHRPGASAYPPLDKTLPQSRIGQEAYWVLRTSDFDAAYRRLADNHVKFVAEPRVAAYGREAVFEDLYGNLFILQQPTRR